MGNQEVKFFQQESRQPENSYSQLPIAPSQFDIGLSRAMGIEPPIRGRDEGNSAKIWGYYFSSNICWLLALLLVIVIMAILGGVFDAGLNNGWSSQGSRRLNDRHVPISSVHSGNIDLGVPTFSIPWTNSSSITPAIWNGRVFFASWNGSIAALDDHTGEVIWIKNICIDYYGLNPTDCNNYVTNNASYYTVATPTVWGSNIVVSVMRPAEILVLDQATGDFVKKATITSNARAILSQSGTVWDDSLIIGTSIGEQDSFVDSYSGCTFVGELVRWDLESNNLIWRVKMSDPMNNYPLMPTGFSGMPIMGSSPAFSVTQGLIAISVGSLICKPTWYAACEALINCTANVSSLNYTHYANSYEECHNNGTAATALFNSIAVFDYENGALKWHEKLLGHRAWKFACLGFNSTTPCLQTTGVSDPSIPCLFKDNPYSNCPTEHESCSNVYDWVNDPTLQIHSNGEETLYVMQHSGIIYAFDFNNDDISINTNGLPSHFKWARAVSKGRGGGGIALNRHAIYFSIHPPSIQTFGLQNWTSNDNQTTYCGGWGALETANGLPIWYTVHPLCNAKYIDCTFGAGINSVITDLAGSRSAPTVTNDLVFGTSIDTSRGIFTYDYLTDDDYCGGSVYAFQAHTGQLLSSYDTGEPFYKQGVSLHDRCIYAGSGGNPTMLQAQGDYLVGWCVEHA